MNDRWMDIENTNFDISTIYGFDSWNMSSFIAYSLHELYALIEISPER